MSDIHTTEQKVLRAFEGPTDWTHLADVITEMREVGYETRKIIAAVRRLVALGLLRGSSAQRFDYQLTDEGRRALMI